MFAHSTSNGPLPSRPPFSHPMAGNVNSRSSSPGIRDTRPTFPSTGGSGQRFQSPVVQQPNRPDYSQFKGNSATNEPVYTGTKKVLGTGFLDDVLPQGFTASVKEKEKTMKEKQRDVLVETMDPEVLKVIFV